MDDVEKFRRDHPLYAACAARFERLIREIIQESGIDVHVIESRVKSVDSFSEKIKRPGKFYSNPLADMPDIIGCRVIVHYGDDVGRVVDVLSREFSVVEHEGGHQPDKLDVDKFGYLSVHLVVAVGEARRELLEWRFYSNFRAEIQIRTVIQHAWSAVSHALQYKQGVAIPSKLQRRLVRIAGMFELADDEFIGIRDQRLLIANEVSKSLENGETYIDLNEVAVMEGVHRWKYAKKSMAFAMDVGFKYFENNEANISEILECILLIGVKNVDEIINFEPDYKFYKRLIDIHQKNNRNSEWFVNEPFLFLLGFIGKYKNNDFYEIMVKNGWSKGIVEQIRLAAEEL